MIGITDFDLEKTIQILTDKQDDEFDSGDDEIPENVGYVIVRI